LEEPAAFIFKVMVYSEVGEGDNPEDVGRCVVAAVKLWVLVVIIVRLLHCMFSIVLDKLVEPLYNTVFVRLVCFNPVRHHSHIFLTILFFLGTWLHSSVGTSD
jgi:hypothetical protein